MVGVQGCKSFSDFSPIMPSTTPIHFDHSDDSDKFCNDTGHDGIFSLNNTASSDPNSVLVLMTTVGADEGGDDVIVSVKESVSATRIKRDGKDPCSDAKLGGDGGRDRQHQRKRQDRGEGEEQEWGQVGEGGEEDS